MSAWMYSMMWPMWNAPLAYGKAVVTNSFWVMGVPARGAADSISRTDIAAWRQPRAGKPIKLG
jgi:hypothetical protein